MNDVSALIRLRDVKKTYQMPDKDPRLVLEGVDFTLQENEIVSVLGQSGCGKSTLLRIIAGLMTPNGGEVFYRGQPVRGPVPGIAMVFQTFALFPWLTVLENVELGLQALGIPRAERRQRALQAIDKIGLDGFETAYPKELSGGMRQRVGFARALVVNPEVLLLDEPFSALDVLTAETLRNDLLELWDDRVIPTKGIVLVSHNIQEALEISDRLIILSRNPGRIRAEIPIALPHPRDPHNAGFRALVDDVYTLLSTPEARPVTRRLEPVEEIGVGYRLADVPIQQLSGLVDALANPPYEGRADLPHLAETLHLEVDDLFPLIETLHLLHFALVSQGDIELTPAGRAFWDADILKRKEIFAEHLVLHVPLAAHIRRVLDERAGHRAPGQRFLSELEDYLSEDEAERVLKTAINWGRYAEIFAYDYDTDILSLENP